VSGDKPSGEENSVDQPLNVRSSTLALGVFTPHYCVEANDQIWVPKNHVLNGLVAKGKRHSGAANLFVTHDWRRTMAEERIYAPLPSSSILSAGSESNAEMEIRAAVGKEKRFIRFLRTSGVGPLVTV
jgi:hypothetical protein